jgi:hypothetical protein
MGACDCIITKVCLTLAFHVNVCEFVVQFQGLVAI